MVTEVAREKAEAYCGVCEGTTHGKCEKCLEEEKEVAKVVFGLIGVSLLIIVGVLAKII